MPRKWGDFEINNLIMYTKSKGKTKPKSVDEKKEKIRVNKYRKDPRIIQSTNEYERFYKKKKKLAMFYLAQLRE